MRPIVLLSVCAVILASGCATGRIESAPPSAFSGPSEIGRRLDPRYAHADSIDRDQSLAREAIRAAARDSALSTPAGLRAELNRVRAETNRNQTAVVAGGLGLAIAGFVGNQNLPAGTNGKHRTPWVAMMVAGSLAFLAAVTPAAP